MQSKRGKKVTLAVIWRMTSRISCLIFFSSLSVFSRCLLPDSFSLLFSVSYWTSNSQRSRVSFVSTLARTTTNLLIFRSSSQSYLVKSKSWCNSIKLNLGLLLTFIWERIFFKKLFTFSSVLTKIVSPYSCFLVNDSKKRILIRKFDFCFVGAKNHLNFAYLEDKCLFDTGWNWFRSWRIRQPFEPILSGSLGILSIATCFGFCDIFLQQSWRRDLKFEFVFDVKSKAGLIYFNITKPHQNWPFLRSLERFHSSSVNLMNFRCTEFMQDPSSLSNESVNLFFFIDFTNFFSNHIFYICTYVFLRAARPSSQCGKFRNLLSRLFGKNFVRVTI